MGRAKTRLEARLIAMRDGMGYPLSTIATADTNLAGGIPVRVVGTKGVNLVVAPTSSA